MSFTRAQTIPRGGNSRPAAKPTLLGAREAGATQLRKQRARFPGWTFRFASRRASIETTAKVFYRSYSISARTFLEFRTGKT